MSNGGIKIGSVFIKAVKSRFLMPVVPFSYEKKTSFS